MEKIVMNQELILVSYADEESLSEKHIKLRETPLDIANLATGDVVVHNQWVSVDPYLKWFFKEHSDEGLYFPSSKLNHHLPSFAIGKVVMSANKVFEVGDIVTGYYQVSEYCVAQGSALRKINTNLGIKTSYYLGPLGFPGLTAWGGMMFIGDPKAGEQVFVSAAAGAVGLVAAQVAKIKGCRVVGSVGSDEKVKLLKEEYGLDDAFNYKSETDWDAALAKYFPKGIDIYFDNVGGEILEAVLNHINTNARIPLCGMISQYNKNWMKRYGVRNLLNLVGKCGKMEGFLMSQFLNRMDEFVEEVGGYVKDGRLKYQEDVKVGLESFAEAFNSLFVGGKNSGKVLLQISPS